MVFSLHKEIQSSLVTNTRVVHCAAVKFFLWLRLFKWQIRTRCARVKEIRSILERIANPAFLYLLKLEIFNFLGPYLHKQRRTNKYGIGSALLDQCHQIEP